MFTVIILKSFLQAKKKIEIDYLKNQTELLIVKDPSRNEIPWIDEYTLKFSDENKAEINQILYYRYRDSIFYNKNENKWYNEFNQNSSNLEKSCIEESLTNWIP